MGLESGVLSVVISVPHEFRWTDPMPRSLSVRSGWRYAQFTLNGDYPVSSLSRTYPNAPTPKTKGVLEFLSSEHISELPLTA